MNFGEHCVQSTTKRQIEYRDHSLERYSVVLREREWDVNDPEMRSTVAREALGDEAVSVKNWAMWVVDEDRNAAALCDFGRPSYPAPFVEA